jgi:hypothetical protein
MERDRTHRPYKGPEFEERPLLKRPGEIGRLVCGPQPAPGDKISARGDGGCRVDLQQSQSVDEVH